MKLADKVSMDDKKLRFGIIQGRLIKSPSNQLQWFPQEHWKSEFFLAASLGIDFIELIAERNHNPNNPIWTEEGIEAIKELVYLNKLSLYTFCNDFIIDHSLTKDNKVLEQNLHLISRGALLGCKKFILPLFEKSELTIENFLEYVTPLRAIADKANENGITICLETILNGNELIQVLDYLKHPSISVVFDTGNRVAFGHDLSGDIKLLENRISHVHIKDKNKENENVILGTGLVNFLQVFEALADINYIGPYTFETQRGKNPLTTIKHNMCLVDFFYKESFSR